MQLTHAFSAGAGCIREEGDLIDLVSSVSLSLCEVLKGGGVKQAWGSLPTVKYTAVTPFTHTSHNTTPPS